MDTGIILSIGTLVFFGLQWYGARREARLRMRPYLGFVDIAFRETDKDDVIELDAWVMNYGSIPAINATAYGEFVINKSDSSCGSSRSNRYFIYKPCITNNI